MLPNFYYFLLKLHYICCIYFYKNNEYNSRSWSVDAFCLFLAVCRHACLTLGEVTCCPQLSYSYNRCTRYLFQRMLWTRSPTALRSCKGWQHSKYKVFNNWESETEGKISYKGCTDIYFFERGQAGNTKRELGLTKLNAAWWSVPLNI